MVRQKERREMAHGHAVMGVNSPWVPEGQGRQGWQRAGVVVGSNPAHGSLAAAGARGPRCPCCSASQR